MRYPQLINKSEKQRTCAPKRGGMIVCAMLCLLAPSVSHAQLVGDDNIPGTTCDKKGAIQMTANASGPGAYILTCDGNAPSGKWVATLNADLPTANMQVANKLYVDQAVASTGGGGNNCQLPAADTTGYNEGGLPFFCRSTTIVMGGVIISTAINEGRACAANAKCSSGICTPGNGFGQIMPDGSLYVGNFNGYTLYAAPMDQGTGRWKTSYGADDIATDSNDDGLANSNQIPNSTVFPAFKLCKDLSWGGHTDWYLPAQNELLLMYARLKEGTTSGPFGFASSERYWSSTELALNTAAAMPFSTGVIYTGGLKASSNIWPVRCVRRE